MRRLETDECGCSNVAVSPRRDGACPPARHVRVHDVPRRHVCACRGMSGRRGVELARTRRRDADHRCSNELARDRSSHQEVRAGDRTCIEATDGLIAITDAQMAICR